MTDEKKYWEWIQHKEIGDMFDELEHEPCDYITSGASKKPRRELTQEQFEEEEEEDRNQLCIEDLGEIRRNILIKRIQRAKDKKKREAKTMDSEDPEEAGFFECDNFR